MFRAADHEVTQFEGTIEKLVIGDRYDSTGSSIH